MFKTSWITPKLCALFTTQFKGIILNLRTVKQPVYRSGRHTNTL